MTTIMKLLKLTNLLHLLIDYHCYNNTFFSDKITIRKESIIFTGSEYWYAENKSFKKAIIQSNKSSVFKLLFSLFPNKYYDEIIKNAFNSVCIKELDYYPNKIQLTRNSNVWDCITSGQCFIKRSRSKSVIECLNNLN